MGIILLVLLLALILGGLEFAIHVLWWIALVVLVIWLIGFIVRVGEGYRAAAGTSGRGQPMTSTAERARRACRPGSVRPPSGPPANPADVESVTVRYLMYVLLPAWFVPGVADYLMHRRTRIERTSGLGNAAAGRSGGAGIRRRRCGPGFGYLGEDAAVIKDPRTQGKDRGDRL
jgi:hypothetical protein